MEGEGRGKRGWKKKKGEGREERLGSENGRRRKRRKGRWKEEEEEVRQERLGIEDERRK